jgi:diacylglycerol kinase
MNSRLKSFVHAWKGVMLVATGEANFRIHLAAAILVITAGAITGLTPVEWCIILLAIFFVLAMEAANTAVEKVVDLVSPEFNDAAGKAKDISAAAVLLAAIAALSAGLVIFIPKIL